MRTIQSVVVVMLLAAVMLPVRGLASGVSQDKPANVAGAWAIVVETPNGGGTPSVTFKQDGEKLTGAYSSELFGEQKVTGTIKSNAISFTFTAAVEGTSVTVTYTGTVDGATMKGKVVLGDLGEGTFTAKKK